MDGLVVEHRTCAMAGTRMARIPPAGTTGSKEAVPRDDYWPEV